MPHDAASARPVLPFFEFMLYGAKSFSAPRGGHPVTAVVRGRRCTLVEAAPAEPPVRHSAHTPRRAR
jgi:hypothetical protein